MPAPPLCSTGARGFFTTRKVHPCQLVSLTVFSSLLFTRQATSHGPATRHTIFDPEVDVYLVQDVAHAHGRRVGEEHEAQVGRGLVVVHAVLPRAVGDEGVVVAAQLADHVAQAKDGAEDELGVVLGPGALGLCGCCRRRRRWLWCCWCCRCRRRDAVDGGGGPGVSRRLGGYCCCGGGRGWEGGLLRRGEPVLGEDAFRWGAVVVVVSMASAAIGRRRGLLCRSKM
jgi:hypothetical protein